MIELQDYTDSPFYFDIILGLEPDQEYAEGMLAYKEFISSVARSYMPGFSLVEITSQMKEAVRSISPLLVGELPYKESDYPIIKKIKFLYHRIRVLFLTTDKIEKALETYKGSQKVIDLVRGRMLSLEKEINQLHKETQLVHFNLEANIMHSKGELDEGTELIEDFVEEYRSLLNARSYILVDDQKILLNEAIREELLIAFKAELQAHLEMMSFPYCTSNPEESLEGQMKKLHDRKTHLTEKLASLEEFLQGPLDLQI